MKKIKKLLLSIVSACLILITLIIGTPIGVFSVILFICLVFSLVTMPLLSLPVISYFLGLVGICILLKYIYNLPVKSLKLIRPVWWITHISLLSLSWWICWEVISGKYFPLTPTENYLCAMIGVILGVVSVSLPIIIGNTSKSLVEYQNKLIAGIFKKEVTYKAMFVFVIPLLGFSLLLFFFFHNPTSEPKEYIWENRIAAFILTSCIYSIYIFVCFMRRFVEYAINTDELILDKIGKAIERQKQQKGLSSIYDEYAEVYTQILMKKGREQSYVGLDDVFKRLSEYVMTVINENRNYKYSDNYEGSVRYNRFLTKYSQSFFNIWKKVYGDSPTYTYYFSDEYEKIVKSALERSDREVYEPLLFIYQRIAFEITNEEAEAIPIAGIIPWQWFFNIIRDNGFDVSKTHFIGIYLFQVMKAIVKKENIVSFNLFISDTINNIWVLLDTNFPSSVLHYNEQYSIILSKIIYMYTPGEYQSLLNECKTMENGEELSGLVSKKFVLNSISLIVAMIGSYCLFQKRYNLVYIIFEYNQPKNSNIQFVNKDISPDNVNILLKWMNDYYLFQGSYFNLWDDHNDGGFWFSKYISLLYYKLHERKKGKLMPVSYNGKSRQELEIDKFNLNKIKDNIKDFNKEVINKCGLSESNSEAVILNIDNMIEELSEHQKRAQEEQALAPDKVTKLKELVNEYIIDTTPWVNVFSTASSADDITKMIVWPFIVSDNKLIEKSFLAEQDSGIYLGFPHAIAEIIQLKFAFRIESKLRIFSQQNPVDVNSDNYLTKSNFKKRIVKLYGYIVVFINYFGVYDFLSPDDFCSMRDNGPMARIKGGPVIYSIGDRDNVTSRVIVFRESDFTMINVQQTRGEVIDLNKKPDRVKELMSASSFQQSIMSSNELERYLKQRVEISFEYHFTLHVKDNPEVQLLSNI